MIDQTREGFQGWAILELMGHRRLAGFVTDVAMFGTQMLRIDIPINENDKVTQFYGGTAIYCVTPSSEQIARGLAAQTQATLPVSSFELRHLGAPDSEDDYA